MDLRIFSAAQPEVVAVANEVGIDLPTEIRPCLAGRVARERLKRLGQDLDTATMSAGLGIKLTAAEDGTEIYQCWADRVALAYAAWLDGKSVDVTNVLIAEASAYAI